MTNRPGQSFTRINLILISVLLVLFSGGVPAAPDASSPARAQAPQTEPSTTGDSLVQNLAAIGQWAEDALTNDGRNPRPQLPLLLWFAIYIALLAFLGTFTMRGPVHYLWLITHVVFIASVFWTLTGHLGDEIRPTAYFTSALGLFVSLIYTPRHLYYLVSQANPPEGWISPGNPNKLSNNFEMLPSQRSLIEAIKAYGTAEPHPGTDRLVSLKGDWGSGKTFSLRLASQQLRSEGVPVAIFNVWRHEADINLEVAAYNS